jgi:multiple sugar transport system substrate-binding protein
VLELRGITWDHVRGTGGLRACADAYARERPDVRVAWSVRSLQAFADQSVPELAERFDLLCIDHPSIGEAVAREALVAFDDHLGREALDDQARSSVGASAESYVWEGRRWALATDAAAQVAVARADLLERADVEIPTTWEDTLAAAEVLRRAGMWAAMPSIPIDAFCSFLAVCRSLGDEPFSAGDVVASRATGATALDILSAFVGRSHPSSLEWNPPRMLERMSTEDEVAYCPLAFGYSNYARPGFRPHALRFAGGPAGPDGLPCGTLGGAGLAVSASSGAREESVAFAAFVASAASQRGPYFDGGGQPGHRSAWIDERVNAESGGFFRDTLAAADAAYLRPRSEGYLRFQDEGGAIVHAVLAGDLGPGNALDRLDASYRVRVATERA